MSDDARDRTTDDDTTMAALAAVLGGPELDAGERDAVLDLTRVVAHGVRRRFGPLAAYAIGLSLATATSPTDRTAALRGAIARLEAQADGRPADGGA